MKGESDERPWTMPLPEFGKRYYSLGRSASYAAASRGDIPVIRVGGKLLGLPRVAEAQLSQAEHQTSRADSLPQAPIRHMLDPPGRRSAAARTRGSGAA
jgi:hypothetical protein